MRKRYVPSLLLDNEKTDCNQGRKPTIDQWEIRKVGVVADRTVSPTGPLSGNWRVSLAEQREEQRADSAHDMLRSTG